MKYNDSFIEIVNNYIKEKYLCLDLRTQNCLKNFLGCSDRDINFTSLQEAGLLKKLNPMAEGEVDLGRGFGKKTKYNFALFINGILDKVNELPLLEDIRKFESKGNVNDGSIVHTELTSDVVKTLMSYEVAQKYYQLSNLAANALRRVTQNKVTFESLMSLGLIRRDNVIQGVRGVGVKAQTELGSFFNSLCDAFEFYNDHMHKYSNVDLLRIKNKALLLRESILESDRIAINSEADIEYERFIPLCCVVIGLKDRSIKHIPEEVYSDALGNHLEQVVLNDYLKTTYGEKIHCKLLAKKYNRSDEGIRTIAARLVRDIIPKRLNILRKLEFPEINTFLENNYVNKGFVTEESVLELLDKNNSNLTTDFFTYLISHLTTKLTLFGCVSYVIQNRKKNAGDKYIGKHLYLISSDLYKCFDFNACCIDLQKRVNQTYEEDYILYARAFFSDFFYDQDDITNYRDILPVLEYIIWKEFDLLVNSNNQIVFERNTSWKIEDYIYVILEKEDTLLTKDEIFERIQQEFPELEIPSAESVRSACNISHKLMSSGKSGKYGLQSWADRGRFSSKTIPELSKEILSTYDRPLHIMELYPLIASQREAANPKSVLNNIQVSKDKDFKLYRHNYIGLTEKNYDSSIIKEIQSIPRGLGKKIGIYRAKNNHKSDEEVIDIFEQQSGLKRAIIENILSFMENK